MKVYLLQTDDYEPQAYGVFSTLKKAEEVAKTTEYYNDKWIVTEFVIDDYKDEDFCHQPFHRLDFSKPKKPSKWRT